VYPGLYSATMTNLFWSHAIASSINMTVLNAPGQWANQTGDAMFDRYIYNYYMGQPIVIGFSGVPAGYYDLYLYGHGAADNQNGIYQVNSITQQTAVTNCWNQPIGTNWVQGIHYVRYASLVVGTNGILTVNVLQDTAGYPIINGLQLAASPTTGAPIISVIPNQTATSGTTLEPISFTVGDGQTQASNLTVSAVSSNQSLVPNGNIVTNGSGANRTITVTPVANQTGDALITVTVSDGSTQTSSLFVVTVLGADSDGDGLPENLSLKITISQPRNGTNLP
jgi:hypothetical protein